MGYTLPISNLQAFAPGNKAILKLPAGKGAPTYDQIKLILGGGLTPAHILGVQMKANGRLFYDEGSGTIINKRDDYKKTFSEAGFVVLDFTNKVSKNGSSEALLSAIPGSLLQDLTAEIQIAAGAPVGGTLKAQMNYRPPTDNPYVVKMLNRTESFSAAGSDSSPNTMYLPTGGAGGKMTRIWIHESVAGAITAAQIRIANNVVFETTRANMENDQKRFDMLPQAGVFVLDFIMDGSLAGLLDTANAPQVELRLTTSAGATYTAYYELIDPIGRL